MDFSTLGSSPLRLGHTSSETELDPRINRKAKALYILKQASTQILFRSIARTNNAIDNLRNQRFRQVRVQFESRSIVVDGLKQRRMTTLQAKSSSQQTICSLALSGLHKTLHENGICASVWTNAITKHVHKDQNCLIPA